MGRTGTNNGGGPRWATMPRGTCPKCGLTRPVGVTQHESGYYCRNQTKCEARAAKKRGKCLICKKRDPRPDDEFCSPCLDEVWATAPETDDDEGFDCIRGKRFKP